MELKIVLVETVERKIWTETHSFKIYSVKWWKNQSIYSHHLVSIVQRKNKTNSYCWVKKKILSIQFSEKESFRSSRKFSQKLFHLENNVVEILLKNIKLSPSIETEAYGSSGEKDMIGSRVHRWYCQCVNVFTKLIRKKQFRWFLLHRLFDRIGQKSTDRMWFKIRCRMSHAKSW